MHYNVGRQDDVEPFRITELHRNEVFKKEGK